MKIMKILKILKILLKRATSITSIIRNKVNNGKNSSFDYAEPYKPSHSKP